jgi:hypothetical protein
MVSGLSPASSARSEAAYRRSDAFDKRRELMNAWAGYLSTPAVAKIVTMARA